MNLRCRVYTTRMGKDKRITRATTLRPCLLLAACCYTLPKGMEAKFLTPLTCSRLPPQRCLLNEPSSTLRIPLRDNPHRLQLVKVHSSNSNNNSNDNNGDTLPPISSPPPSITPPDTAEVRFRGSKKRSRSKQQQEVAGPISKQPPPPPPKKWESMTFSEKALELYMGEKGLLFWLNKFAYASIYITIGAWILFRFVGPSLGFYQLDSPALSPSGLFK